MEKQRERCVRERDDQHIDERLQRLRTQVTNAYAELGPLKEIHPNVQDWLIKNEEKVNFQVDYLKKKVWQAQRKRCRVALIRLQELEDGVAPHHSRQERVLNPLSFVVRYGLSFVDRIAELPMTGDFSEHQIQL
ncbi:MAG TPA: bacillithiol biosynthesis BshC [Desulfosporosinus sp.]